MSSPGTKRAIAAALAGATLAVGATSASAGPMQQNLDQAGDSVGSASVPPPPSSIAAPAGKAYEDLRSTGQTAGLPTSAPQAVVDEPSGPSGFDLPSAALGAATGAGLVILLLTAGALIRRRPLTRRHGTIGA